MNALGNDVILEVARERVSTAADPILIASAADSRGQVEELVATRGPEGGWREATIQVVDGSSGAPITSAVIKCEGRGGGTQIREVDSHGIATIRLPEFGTTPLRVSAPGFAAEFVENKSWESGTTVVKMRRSGRLQIEVIDVGVTLPSDLRGYAWPSGGGPGAPSGSAGNAVLFEVEIGPDGLGEFTGLDPGTRYSVAILGGGMITPTPVDGVLADGSVVRVEPQALYGITLRPSPADETLAVRNSELFCEFPTGWTSLPRDAELVGVRSPIHALVTSQLRSIPADVELRDMVLCASPVGRPAPEMEFVLAIPGWKRFNGIVQLEPVIRSLAVADVPLVREVEGVGDLAISLRGLIGGDSGGPQLLPEAVLRMVARGRSFDGRHVEYATPLQMVRDERVVIESIPVGDYDLYLVPRYSQGLGDADRSAIPTAFVSVSETETAEVTLTVAGVGGLEILATEAGASFAGFLDVEIRRAGQGWSCPVIWENGRYILHALPIGSYTVAIRPGFRGNPVLIDWTSIPFEVIDGASTQVRLEVPSWGMK